jgi:hypothetical protein
VKLSLSAQLAYVDSASGLAKADQFQIDLAPGTLPLS